MSDAAIRSALLTRLATVSGYPTATNRADEGQAFDPDLTAVAPWVRTTLLFGNERLRTIPSAGGEVERRGFLQVDYFIPWNTTTAQSTLDTLCQATKDLFPSGQSLTVSGKPLWIRESRRWVARRDGAYLTDHVDITWEYRSVNPTLS